MGLGIRLDNMGMKERLYYSSPWLGVTSYTILVKIQREMEETSGVRASAPDDSEGASGPGGRNDAV